MEYKLVSYIRRLSSEYD